MSEVGAAGSAVEESVVLAVFDNRNAAERMLRSLGREFRQKAHSGDAAALVISGNRDASPGPQSPRVDDARAFAVGHRQWTKTTP